MYKLLSHNDLDGVGCGILGKLAFGEDIKVRYNSIASLNKEIEYFLENDPPDTFLFITDLSPDEEKEKRLNQHYQQYKNIQLIDHHKTALHLNNYEWGSVLVENDKGKLESATSLFYQFLVANEVLQPTAALDEFVELVRQYDTWEWEENDNRQAHNLNSLFFLVSIDEFEETMLERLSSAESFDFDEFEKKLLNMEEDKIGRYIRRKKREIVQTKIGEYYVGVVYAESYISELGNELSKEHPHLDYIAILNMGSKKISLRTIHDYVDVSEIAAIYGGGGHQKAAGCNLTDKAYKIFVQQTFTLDPMVEDAKGNRYNVKESSFGTMYTDRNENIYFITLKENKWRIEKNQKWFDITFASFEEAEKYLKRNYEAFLVRDELFVEYLMKEMKKGK